MSPTSTVLSIRQFTSVSDTIATLVAGFKPFPRWTTFMIWNAAPIEDASGTLVAGPRMSTLKYTASDEIDDELVTDWLAQAIA